ncbi:hypothetical protein [Lentzea albida]|uniref:2TM domain-containing protein n=1 Tax=Lentzea albida TaxID=65499 RepID=A0A1H9V722_9PSEU|nr:hypothetical protein [Lentzea albida]SES17472.1 hypothetical protein SAMN04488000_11779 [Lentzea albida]
MTEIFDQLRENLILALIIGCEIGFWFFLLAGLVARYPLRSPKVGGVLLLCTPLVDVVLLVVTVFDLRTGGEATWPHAAAAIYLGLTLGFGHSMMRWADQRFQHRFAGGPPPVRPPKYGRAKVRYEWKQFGRFAIAWLISAVIMGGLVFFVSTPAQTEVLWKVALPVMTGTGVAWFVLGPFLTTIRPPRPRRGARETYVA